MNTVSPGYVFETVFWIENNPGQEPRLVARHINGQESPHPILSGDPRILPGKKSKVRVQSLDKSEIQVEYLGLVDFSLEESVYVDPVLLKHFEILLSSGRSILLEGPQGTGKTTISRSVAQSLAMDYVFFNCSVCFEPSDFVGTLQLTLDESGAAKTEWLPTEVLEAIYKAHESPYQRVLIFLDELNRCRSYALNGIMSAIDSTKRIFDPRKNHYVPIPDNIQWIAAINSGKQFTGTYKLDLAQLDRFAVLKMDYPPQDKEQDILQRRYPMVKAKLLRKLVRIAHEIRRHKIIQTDLSMRATDEAALFLSYPGMGRASKDELLNILRTSFCNRLPGSIDEPESDANLAYQIIEKHVLLNDQVFENKS